MTLVYAPTKPVGTALRQLRRARRMTQVELAENSGITAAAVRDIEKGQVRRPNTKTLKGLAQAFGLSLDDLKYHLGLAPFGTPGPYAGQTQQHVPLPSMPYGDAAHRLVLLYLDLTPSQQAQLESVALALHSQRLLLSEQEALAVGHLLQTEAQATL